MTVAAVAALALAAAGCTSAPRWVGAPASGPTVSSPTASADPVGPSGRTFTLSAVGDTIMAAAPRFVPPDGGAGLFDAVAPALRSDLQMANLEEPITDTTTSTKCSSKSLGKTCFAYRAPSGFAAVLHRAGFDVVNIANNHALDYGTTGHADTEHLLSAAGVAWTGTPGRIAVVTVKGVKVAVVGFAPYAWANNLLNIPACAKVIARARTMADIVVVQAHMGGEGAKYQHVPHGPQYFLGENRGDAIAFSHAMIDAGADIVIGHSPHVLRAMEFYKGHLIAYSLGNFTGYHALNTGGPMGVSLVLRVTLRGDGAFVKASMVPISVVSPGLPRPDPARRAITTVRALTRSDFPSTGATIATSGAINPPES